jgi:hypothetical protein
MNMEERKNEIYSLIKEVNDEDVVEYIFKIVKDITKTGTSLLLPQQHTQKSKRALQFES